jgi:Response regulators consisting of a CheY-like receiver domain and a winged-helix DNA-binding domain
MGKMSQQKKYSILIIDDDKDLSDILIDMYTDYGHIADYAPNAEKAYEILEKKNYDMILLDINLPVGDGFEVCKELRKVSRIPIIFASARTSEDDKLKGLDIGGDDYLPKPYSLKELLSRTNSLLRRTYGYTAKNEEIWIGKKSGKPIYIDPTARQVKKGEEWLSLSLKEFDLLYYLAQRRNQVVPKEELLTQIWGIFFQVEDATLNVHIRWIREKLEENPSRPEYIKTVRGVGYRLEDEDEYGS